MDADQQKKEERVRAAAHARIQRGLELIDQGLHMLRILAAPDSPEPGEAPKPPP